MDGNILVDLIDELESLGYATDPISDILRASEDSPKAKNKDVTRVNVQWMKDGDKYFPCKETTAKLEPGLYYTGVSQTGYYVRLQNNITDDLVVTPDSKTEEIVKEIDKFWNKKEDFAKYGLVHKRGILLYGVPGSGKTSLISLVIAKIIAAGGVALMGDADPYVVTACLHFMREISPEMPILLILEDIDSIIKMYGESQVLSLLDGENSINNLVTIASTNYPEDLAGRITNRPSRFDRVIEIGLPSWEARLTYLKSREIGLTDQEYENWADETEGLGISHIKELIVGVIVLENDFDEVLQRLNKMASSPSSSGDKKVGFSNGSIAEITRKSSPPKAGVGFGK